MAKEQNEYISSEAEHTIQESEKRTSMNIALTAEDKLFLKMYALRNSTTVSAVIASYVAELRNEALKQGWYAIASGVPVGGRGKLKGDLE